MPIHPQFLIRGADGNPKPSPELVARIKRFDPRLGLFYTKAAWAITEAWKDDDPRREWIKKGEMQAEYAFDICGYLPVTCALDEAPAYIQRELTSWSPEQFKGLRESVSKWNTQDATGQDAIVEEQVLAAVSNDLDKSNIVTPGIYAAVPFDFSTQGAVVAPEAPVEARKGAGRRDREAV